MSSKTYSPSQRRQVIFLFISILFVFALAFENSAIGRALGNITSIFVLLIILGIQVLTASILFNSSVKITLTDMNIQAEHRQLMKALNWYEISKITDYKLWMKISNQKEDNTIFITAFVEGYSEIRARVAEKRPDLFS